MIELLPRSLSRGFLVLFLTCVFNASASARSLDLDLPFPFRAADVSVNTALSEFTRYTGIPVKTYNVSDANLSFDIPESTLGDFLTELGLQARLSWWYDGLTLHFEDNESVEVETISTLRWAATYLISNLENFGLSSTQYPITYDVAENLIYINGPENYVKFVSRAIDALIESHFDRKESIRDERFHPRIFSGS